MQISNMYSVYDRKAGYYLPIFQTRTDAEAVRHFTEAVVSSETPISKYPSDFELCHMGTIDLDTGEILPLMNARVILNGLSALQASQAERQRYRDALDVKNADELFHPSREQSAKS